MRPTTLSLFTVAALTAPALAQTVLYPVGLPNNGFTTIVRSLSRDGKAAAGNAEWIGTPPSRPDQSFRWTLAGGREDFQTPIVNASSESRGFGISGDGSTVVGAAFFPTSNVSNAAYRRLADGTLQLLDHVSGYSMYGTATAANYDGSVVVGFAELPQTFPTARPFIWTKSGGTKALGGILNNGWNQAYDVSDDGKTVVGHYEPDFSGTSPRGFVWKDDGTITLLTAPAGQITDARACSGDGNIVVGGYNGTGAAKWDHGAFSSLGLVGDWRSASANGVSDDGKVVIGQLFNSPTHPAFGTFVWTESTGMMESIDFLRAAGVPMPIGTNYVQIYCVSGDGMSVGGEFYTAAGDGGGFVATIPSPGVPALGVFGMLLARRRR